jgi:hypothetical protein
VKTQFSPAQETAISYLALCGENQGDAYRAARDAARAIETTLSENERLNAHQLQGVEITPELVSAAVGRVMATWISWQGC